MPPSRGTEMVRTIDAASFAATAAPAAQHDVKPAIIMFDSESTAELKQPPTPLGHRTESWIFFGTRT